MTFAGVLRDIIEKDDGLILRVASYERMVAQREKRRGWSERFWGALVRRSRKIFGFKRADGAFEKRSEKCH